MVKSVAELGGGPAGRSFDQSIAGATAESDEGCGAMSVHEERSEIALELEVVGRAGEE